MLTKGRTVETQSSTGAIVGQIRGLHARGELPLILRGRPWSLRDLRMVLQAVAEHYSDGRTKISEVVCERLDWRQPNGWLKDRACRDVLLRLEEMGLLKLPPRLAVGATGASPSAPDVPPLEVDLSASISMLPHPLSLQMAKRGPAVEMWNWLVKKYHYRGHAISVGRSVKYLMWSGDTILGAIGFSSPAWKVACRDRLLRKLGLNEEGMRDAVINNNRFLILPNVKVKTLASQVLARSAKRVRSDWRDYYGAAPVLIETFVEPKQFDGTCYRAANWTEIGSTRGYSKTGGTHRNSQQPKKVFVYGLNRAIRNQLARMVSPQ